ncbi:MATE family efflux transporter [Porphyrobacter sp. CACIAM 03H1]|jgi:putative MATE family efflux protein|uniref:MATE family efflux transporter n=1 Tax=Porphyrobacter sp. CACIAM 03H1 TaxID=2003315 RepID=UPI000B5A8FF0|nr:MATE family efflux transporter [Porphyrobacter sp. CACIAM 03H1]ASJ92233.1 MATE family efflux transporter [Porphyrobacter sp. CACIAM 03H1]
MTAPAPSSARLVSGSIPGHLVSQTLPAVIGVAAIMSIGIVDAYFIGQLGSAPLAAISFIFPVAVASTSLGVGVMVGINSVVARALGEGDMDRAAKRANFGIVFALACGLVMGLALWLLIDPIFSAMNAPAHLMPLIRVYMAPYAMGFPLSLAIMGFNGVLRGQGEAKRTSTVSITYAAANWVLNPILITGAFGFPGFGIAGSAYATVIGWGVGVCAAMWLLRGTPLPLNLGLLRDCDLAEQARAIIRVGLPASFSNAINPLGLSVLTALVALEGEAAVAGFGAAGRLQSFVIVPLLGLSGAIGAIVGQNWGARRFDRAREATLYAAGFCVVWGLLVAILMMAAGASLARVFTDDPAVVAEFDLYLKIAAWGYAGFGLLIVGNGIMNAVDKAAFALVQSVARVFLVMLPVALMLQPDMGSAAIFTAELAANLFGGVSAILLVRHIFLRQDPAWTPAR